MPDEPIVYEDACQVPGCPESNSADWHIPHCGHGLAGHHHHWPKRSQGGRRVVAFLCPECHRKADEGPYVNAIEEAGDGTEHYKLTDENGKVIVDRVIGRWRPETEEEAAASKPHVTAEPYPALLPRNQTALLEQVTRAKWLPMGLEFPDDLTFDEWTLAGGFLARMGRGVPWWVGDWLRVGQWRWGEKYAQAASDTGFKEERLMQYQWVAEHVQISRRVKELSWSHHREVADLDADQQGGWLQRAVDEGMTVNEFRLAIRGEETQTERLYRCPECGHEGPLADFRWERHDQQ